MKQKCNWTIDEVIVKEFKCILDGRSASAVVEKLIIEFIDKNKGKLGKI